MFFSWYQKRIFTLKKLFFAQINSENDNTNNSGVFCLFVFASKSEKTLTRSNFTNFYSALSSVVSNRDELVGALSDEMNSSLEGKKMTKCTIKQFTLPKPMKSPAEQNQQRLTNVYLGFLQTQVTPSSDFAFPMRNFLSV